MSDGSICTSCGKHKQTLYVVKSRLIPGAEWYVCEDCKDAGYEPRFAIVIVGRSEGLVAVSKYISKHLYVGEDILASELA